MLRFVIAPATLALLATLGRAQDPPPPPVPAPPAPPAPEKKDDSGAKKEDAAKEEAAEAKFVVDTSADATRLLRECEKAFADKEPRARAEALEKFALHRNEAYPKAIAPFLKDKNADVARAAARALANQPFPASTDALLNFATNPKVLASTPELAAEAILALGGAGLGKKGYDRLREIFDDGDKGVKTAIMRAFFEQKEKKAFSFFVDHCDEPQGDIKNPANPPASYWKARFEEWNEYKQYVRRGLKAITGQSLATAKAYIEWSQGAGKKSGFVYERGH